MMFRVVRSVGGRIPGFHGVRSITISATLQQPLNRNGSALSKMLQHSTCEYRVGKRGDLSVRLLNVASKESGGATTATAKAAATTAAAASSSSADIKPGDKSRNAPANKSKPASSEISMAFMSKYLSKHLWPQEWNLRARVVAALTLLVGSKVANVGVPVLLKDVVNALAEPGSVQETLLLGAALTPVTLLIAYGSLRLCASFMYEFRSSVFAKVTQTAVRRVGLEVFRHLHQLDLSFHLGRETGGLARALDRGSRGINTMLSLALFNIAPTILEIGLVSAFLALQCGPEFVATSVGTIGVFAVFTLGITQWRTKFRKYMNAADNEAGTRVVDSLINYETVKYFNNEEREAKRYDESLSRYQDAALKTQTSLSWLNFGQQAILTGGITAMMLLAAFKIQEGLMTVGDLVMVQGLLFQLSVPLNFLGSSYRDSRQAIIDMENMFKLLVQHQQVKDDPAAKPLVLSEGGTVEFRNVHFSYSPDRPILQDVSFQVPAGHKVAIVGPSGCGKSTITRLLYRFYDPNAGDVFIDHQNAKLVTLESLRRNIGVVPQDTVLFNASIGYNIAYGSSEEVGQDVIERVSRAAQIHDAITHFPKGYDTVVGERGLKLSGGEKQRVAIARAMMKKPQIFIFDEATSSLDSSTEAQLIKELSEISRGYTSIFIAHRLSTVIDADEILVMDQGRIVERGNHQSLVQDRSSRYHEMWQTQQRFSSSSSTSTSSSV